MGKRRIIAETGAGQHGVATATACALLGLECVVYMGTEDMRRQQPNVQRMELLGATVAPVEAGARTLKEAVSAAIRDWVANVGDTHYVIGSCVGPAPFPALVRDLQRVIGDEARAQMLETAGRLPDRVIACVGGGSNAIGTFIAFVDDADVELIGVEAAGEGIETGRHGAPLTIGGRGGVLHGAYSAIMQDEDGQILEAHSISAGLDYPGTGPEHAYLRDSGRARYVAVTDDEALAALRRVAELEGIIPALESSHAVAWVLRGDAGAGHARPGLPLRPRGQGPRGGPAEAWHRGLTRAQRIAAAFAAAAGRAALMPYLMGGFPDLEASVAIGARLRGRRRRPRRARRAVLGPARRRPGHPRRGHARARRRARTCTACSRSPRRIAERLPVVLMCYANPILARGAGALRHELVGGRRQRADRARPAARGGRRGARGLRRRRARARAADRAHDARRPDAPRSCAARVDLSTRCRSRAPPASAPRVDGALAAALAHAKAHSPVPVAVGFGISTPEQAAARGRRGRRRRDRRLATGPRRGEAAEAGADPAAAVGELVAALAKALQR